MLRQLNEAQDGYGPAAGPAHEPQRADWTIDQAFTTCSATCRC